jgi:cell division transport system ATP-binding protein
MIHFREVAKHFGTGRPAVTELTFRVHPGEFVFLTGHSGSGKSTVLKLLTREYNLSSGEIEFHNKPLSKLKRGQFHTHRRQIGMIFQDYRLIPELNIWENIAIPLHIMSKSSAEIAERVTELLTMIQLGDKAHMFPSQLSGGEAQRVAIARSLAGAPSLLLADEPTGNLDAKNAHYITELLKKINQLGTTIVYATHDLNLIKNNPQFRHIILEEGKLVHDSNPDTAPKTSKTEPLEPDVDEPDDEPEDDEIEGVEEYESTAEGSDQDEVTIEIIEEKETPTPSKAKKTEKPDKKAKAAKTDATVEVLVEEL